MVEFYLLRIKKTPKDKALEVHYEKEINDKKVLTKKLMDEKERLNKRLKELSVEIGKSLVGESNFTSEMLTLSINSTKEELERTETLISENEKVLEEKKELLKNLDFRYNQFLSWANEFEDASMEEKKMIICQLIKSIKVSKDYKMEVEFNVSYQQFFSA